MSAVSTENQSPIPRAEEDGILLIVPAWIFGHEIRALIDSGATHNFISPARVMQCGLRVESHKHLPGTRRWEEGVVTGTSCRRTRRHVRLHDEDQLDSQQPVAWC